MLTAQINITTLDAVKKFIQITNRYMNLKIHLLLEDYIIDAHSVMGIFSLGMNKTVELQAEGDSAKDFIKEISVFCAA